MKITEEDINHNAMQLISAITLCVFENKQEHALMEEAYIRGVLELADELKKVLRE